MIIDPRVKKLIIFNGGGGIVEREMKVSIQQGTNDFQLANVPASFDPNSANVELKFLKSEDLNAFTLQQTIVSLPDWSNSNKIIEKEKSAANSIISYSIDFTREMREKISTICESSSYRNYEDMNGVFNFIVDAKREGEVIVKIKYFVNDLRIKWETTLQVSIDKSNESAEIEGFIVVENLTGFSYENVELGFAIFNLPIKPVRTDYYPDDQKQAVYEETEQAYEPYQEQKIKRTQRLKNLML
ncbi:MAG: hypothetical protein JW891_14325 [Candidatus Lokiarchaeota archaeon]|nr:hypothetical protein [Candidatus Lokiarchaeota archaeon]